MFIETHRTLALFLVCACSLAWLHAEGATGTNDADNDELIRLEKVWNDAHLQGEAEKLDHLWSNDIEIVVPSMAAMNKATALAFARSGRMKFRTYETSNLQVRLFGDIAIVSGQMKRSRTLQGNSVTDNWLFTKVYHRKDGRWQVIHFQASQAAPA